MKGYLHIAPVLHLPYDDIAADDITLTVEASHRVLAPYRPVVRKAHSIDQFAIAGMRDSVFGWSVDLGYETGARPLTFQFNWIVLIDGHDRACQHRLTLQLEPTKKIKDPLWSTDTSLWSEAPGSQSSGAYRAPISVFTQSQLLDELQRDLTLTARPHITTISETLSIPAVERGDMAVLMSERYAVAGSAAA